MFKCETDGQTGHSMISLWRKRRHNLEMITRVSALVVKVNILVNINQSERVGFLVSKHTEHNQNCPNFWIKLVPIILEIFFISSHRKQLMGSPEKDWFVWWNFHHESWVYWVSLSWLFSATITTEIGWDVGFWTSTVIVLLENGSTR